MPRTRGWVIRPAAEADLSEIWLESAISWGVKQADRYADGLFAIFDLLAEFPEIVRERGEFTPPVRIHSSGSHLLFYRPEGHGIEIIRVIHAHQNLMTFLQEW